MPRSPSSDAIASHESATIATILLSVNINFVQAHPSSVLPTPAISYLQRFVEQEEFMSPCMPELSRTLSLPSAVPGIELFARLLNRLPSAEQSKERKMTIVKPILPVLLLRLPRPTSTVSPHPSFRIIVDANFNDLPGIPSTRER